MEEKKLPEVVRITEGAIIHYTVQVNLNEFCWLVTDDASFTSPMVIPSLHVCFAGVSYTALPEYKQLTCIYSDVPSWNTSIFVWTVDILILFWCFSCFHCHLCHCSHQQLELSLPLTSSSSSSSSPSPRAIHHNHHCHHKHHQQEQQQTKSIPTLSQLPSSSHTFTTIILTLLYVWQLKVHVFSYRA